MSVSRRGCVLLFGLSLVAPMGSLLAGSSDTVFRNGFELARFTVQTPGIEVAPGAEGTWCYYFRTPNVEARALWRWASTMDAGMHHLILFTTVNEIAPEGSLVQSPCSSFGGSTPHAWNYVAHDQIAELVVPADDGSGMPLGIALAPNQPAFLQMYVINTGAAPIIVSAELTGDLLPPDTLFIPTATYLAFMTDISIPPQSTSYSVEKSCVTPNDAKFWWLSTRTHQFAITSEVRDGSSPVVVSPDWEHPATAMFSAPDFFSFSTGALTHACTYNNPTGSTISFGESETTNETCMGIGYFFPATDGAKFCVNGIGPL